MTVLVLGPGCARCTELFVEVERVIAEAGIDAELSKVDALDEIMRHGVMFTPALVIDGVVKVSGEVPSAEKILAWLQEAAAVG